VDGVIPIFNHGTEIRDVASWSKKRKDNDMKKLFLILLVISILGLAACSVFNQQPQITSQPADQAGVTEAVNRFYTGYDACMKNPPAGSEGKVSEYCQNNSGITTAAFAGNLEAGGTAKAGADPVFCAQDIPETMSVNTDMQITANKASASVLEKFETTQINIQVDLVNENGVWKINNIICPLP
jgi:hypothetical protein